MIILVVCVVIVCAVFITACAFYRLWLALDSMEKQNNAR